MGITTDEIIRESQKKKEQELLEAKKRTIMETLDTLNAKLDLIMTKMEEVMALIQKDLDQNPPNEIPVDADVDRIEKTERLRLLTKETRETDRVIKQAISDKGHLMGTTAGTVAGIAGDDLEPGDLVYEKDEKYYKANATDKIKGIMSKRRRNS